VRVDVAGVPGSDRVRVAVRCAAMGEAMVPGLRLVADYVDEAGAAALVAAIDAAPWRDDLKRRVQHYGYRYAYSARRVDAAQALGPLPDWLAALAEAMVADAGFARAADQVIVNEYLPGQGISGHVDCLPCFGPAIASLSLLSGTTMTFIGPDRGRVDVWLPARSLVVLTGPARATWKHAIAGRRGDPGHGPRGRRLSLTLRTVIRG
jgi:alkylated DNA repair dioxygenase AlkB